jgi:hypothetical protein
VKVHPVASRLLFMVGIFLLLVPIALAFNHGDGHVVRADGLPGAVVGGDAIEAATTSVAVRPTHPPTSRASAVSPTAASTTSTTVEAHTSWTAASSVTSWSHNTTTWTTTSMWHAPTTSWHAPTTSSSRKWQSTTSATTAAPRTQTSTTSTTITAPTRTYTRAEVEAIIRSVWPANLADEAVRIATRESNLRAAAHNWCCYGIFQIYFAMNRPALASVGVTEATQLFDPLVNATAAYAIYLRDGWGPWQ